MIKFLKAWGHLRRKNASTKFKIKALTLWRTLLGMIIIVPFTLVIALSGVYFSVISPYIVNLFAINPILTNLLAPVFVLPITYFFTTRFILLEKDIKKWMIKHREILELDIDETRLLTPKKQKELFDDIRRNLTAKRLGDSSSIEIADPKEKGDE